MNTNSGFVAIVQYKTSNNYILPGNITPNEWYQRFTNKRGAPDLALISVLSEIVYWYRPKKAKDPDTGSITYVNKFLGDAWQTSYDHFEKKFGFNREKLRRVFVKLEQMGICAREFRNVKLRGQTYNNRLFIHLSSEFLNSCTTHKENHTKNKDTDSNTSFFVPKEEGGSPHFEGDHIIDIKNKNIIIKDRSIKSNFCKISFKEKKIKQTAIQSVANGLEKGRGSNTNQIKGILAKAKELKDFYPLTKEDCQRLQSLSKREFSLNAMNEILLDMSKRVIGVGFESKNKFLNYMGKAFAGEFRDAVKINNENFKIKSNKTCKEITLEEQEKYLTEIEYNLQVSPEWHLKKKLACVFDTDKSYELLRAYRSISQKGSVFTLQLDKHVELTEPDRKIILKQVKATHEIIDLNQGEITMIDKLQIKMPEKLVFEARESRAQNNKPKAPSAVIPDTIWGRVRKSLITNYGEAIDRNWFSRLDAEIDEKSRAIHLKTPSSFIKDWIQTNYFDTIEKFGMGEEYRVVMV
jgi:hypothetical protein